MNPYGFSAEDRVVVTGGAGFIGSNVVKRLSGEGVRVVVCDRMGQGLKWRNLRGAMVHDVIRPEALMAYLESNAGRIPAIVHMGAISATTETDVDRILHDNVRTTLDLWTWTRTNGVRLIYATSAATYGDGELGFSDGADLDALLKLKPLNAYGWSKHVVDLRVAADLREGRAGPQWAGLKFFNVYGPGEAHKGDMRSVIHKIIPRVLAGETVELFKSYKDGFADGEQRRDFVFVEDCVSTIAWLLAHPGTSGLFNVGSGQARSFRDLAEITFRALGHELRVHYIEMPEALRCRYQYFTEADMRGCRAAGIAVKPTSLEDGIAAYVEAWREDEATG